MSDPPDALMLSRRFEFPIERGKIVEFARAIHSDNPSFFGRDALAPPTFLMVGGQIWGYSWESPGDSPLAREQPDATPMLHLEEAYRFDGPPLRAGELLQGQLRLLPPVEKVGRRSGPMTIYTTVTTYWREDGNEAARAQQVVARMHGALPADPGASAQRGAEVPTSQCDEPATRRLGPLQLEDFVRYQAASGDLNPYHYDPEVVAAAGGTTLIAPGMLSAGVLGGLVADLYGAANVREIAFSFREPVLLGDMIVCSALPAAAPPERGETLLDLQCLRASGEVAVAGSARVIGGQGA